jgi:long-chain acyl-CoA synthetase
MSGEGTVTTLAQLVDQAARRYADRVAVVDGKRQLSFREVGDRSTRLANALLEFSPTSGSRIALLLSNRLEFVETDFAIAKAGKVKAPINPRLTDDERQFILNNCQAEILVTEYSEVQRVDALRDSLPHLRHIICVDGSADGMAKDYSELLRQASPRSSGVFINPDDPSMILHTSGTTGRPKGATTSQRARVAGTANMLLDEFSPLPADGMVHMAPMSHGSGSKILSFFVRGARNVTMGKFDPEVFAEIVRTGQGTSSFVVPTMIRMLLDALGSRARELSGLRNLTYGGAPMPPALAQEAMDVLGPVLTQVYGSCEAPHPVTVLSQNDHATGRVEYLGSAGHESYGSEVRIVSDTGEDQKDGQPGEIWVRGDSVMSGYWGDEMATDSVFSQGWYRTGDVAQRDEEGFIYIVGRERDMLISGGLNVYPAEIETVLHRHPAVSEAAVFGVPDEVWGESVAAAVVTRAGMRVDADDIVQFCLAHLADYKKPRRVLFVDSLPKGTTGKVAKGELQALFAGNSSSVQSGARS